jgi:hypothetical protein
MSAAPPTPKLSERFQTILLELVEELPELRLPAFFLRPRAFAGSDGAPHGSGGHALGGMLYHPDGGRRRVGSRRNDRCAACRPQARARLCQQWRRLRPPHRQRTVDGIGRGAGTGNGLGDRLTIRSEDGVRGVATSGWRGRSFSLGIADAVTVLARSGAEADAAATLIANAVNLPGDIPPSGAFPHATSRPTATLARAW